MNFSQLANAALEAEKAQLEELFTLRVLLDDQDPIQDIEMDLRDLYTFPERLQQSYPIEWQVFVKRAIKTVLASQPHPGHACLREVLQKRYLEREAWCQALFLLWNTVTEHCLAIDNADNVSQYESPYRKIIYKMIR